MLEKSGILELDHIYRDTSLSTHLTNVITKSYNELAVSQVVPLILPSDRHVQIRL